MGGTGVYGYPQLHSEIETSLSYMKLPQKTSVVGFSVFQSLLCPGHSEVTDSLDIPRAMGVRSYLGYVYLLHE